MRVITHHLSKYAAYHRNTRNIATHLIGIPLIVLAIEVLLSRPQWLIGGLTLSPAILASVAAGIFYLTLDVVLGGALAALLGMGAWAGVELAGLSTGLWLGLGTGMFAFGWALQFVGHAYEGRKPAFFDDITGLIIGPLFIVAEVAFAMGSHRSLKRDIEASLKRA